MADFVPRNWHGGERSKGNGRWASTGKYLDTNLLAFTTNYFRCMDVWLTKGAERHHRPRDGFGGERGQHDHQLHAGLQWQDESTSDSTGLAGGGDADWTKQYDSVWNIERSDSGHQSASDG